VHAAEDDLQRHQNDVGRLSPLQAVPHLGLIEDVEAQVLDGTLRQPDPHLDGV